MLINFPPDAFALTLVGIQPLKLEFVWLERDEDRRRCGARLELCWSKNNGLSYGNEDGVALSTLIVGRYAIVDKARIYL